MFFWAPWSEIVPKKHFLATKFIKIQDFLDENVRCQLLVIKKWMMKPHLDKMVFNLDEKYFDVQYMDE